MPLAQDYSKIERNPALAGFFVYPLYNRVVEVSLNF